MKEIKSILMASTTEEKDMSKASIGFASALLNDMSITWENTVDVEEIDADQTIDTFQWEQKLENGGTGKLTENEGTSAALQWIFGKLDKYLTFDGRALGIRDVRGKALFPLKVNHKVAKGKSDGCIAVEVSLALCEDTSESIYSYGMALVEMKTSRNSISKAQLLLQLAAFSNESSYRRATVLLRTDGNKSWYLLHFKSWNKICVTQYKSGRKCLKELQNLLKSIDDRKELLEKSSRKRPPLDSIAEDQNLAGFSLSDGTNQGNQEDVDKAMEKEASLRQLANALAQSPLSDGVRPTIPEWALARNVVPSYYL